jgi:hypothetical protein
MPDIPVRVPPASTPDMVRNAAASAGRRRRAPDMGVLERVRDALVRLPYSALGPYYYRIPGDRLASPRSAPLVTGRRHPSGGRAAGMGRLPDDHR